MRSKCIETKKHSGSFSVQFNVWHLEVGAGGFTLCFVIAPTMSGHTIPESVPTPLEIPMSMLAYRGAMSKWLTLKPGRKEGKHFGYLVPDQETPQLALCLQSLAKITKRLISKTEFPLLIMWCHMVL